MLSTAGFSTKLPFLFQTGAQPREWKQYGKSYLITFANSFSNKSSHLILVTKHKEAINSPGFFFFKKSKYKKQKQKTHTKKANFQGSLSSQKLPRIARGRGLKAKLSGEMKTLAQCVASGTVWLE